MKTVIFAAFLLSIFSLNCTKESACPGDLNKDSQSPVIKLISPTNTPSLRPGEYITVKALITDNNSVREVGWEAMNAASVCGNNPYQGAWLPYEPSVDFEIRFLVPANYSGNRFIRIYAEDHYANETYIDVPFIAEN